MPELTKQAGRVVIEQHGVSFGYFELIALFGDERCGQTWLLKAAKQEVAIRITPSGLLRVGRPKKASGISARGTA